MQAHKPCKKKEREKKGMFTLFKCDDKQMYYFSGNVAYEEFVKLHGFSRSVQCKKVVGPTISSEIQIPVEME